MQATRLKYFLKKMKAWGTCIEHFQSDIRQHQFLQRLHIVIRRHGHPLEQLGT